MRSSSLLLSLFVSTLLFSLVWSLSLPKWPRPSRLVEHAASRTRTSAFAWKKLKVSKRNPRPQAHQKQLVEEDLARGPRLRFVLDHFKPMANTGSTRIMIAVASGFVASFLLLGASVAEASGGSTGETSATATVVTKAALTPVVRVPMENSESFLQLASLGFAPAKTTAATTSAPVSLNSFDILGRLARIEETSLTKQDALAGATAFAQDALASANAFKQDALASANAFKQAALVGASVFTAGFALVAFLLRAESKAEMKAMEERMEKRRLQSEALAKATQQITTAISILALIFPFFKN